MKCMLLEIFCDSDTACTRLPHNVFTEIQNAVRKTLLLDSVLQSTDTLRRMYGNRELVGIRTQWSEVVHVLSNVHW